MATVVRLFQVAKEVLPWWWPYPLVAGSILFITALLLLVPFSWWKVAREYLTALPYQMRRVYLWRLYGPRYSISDPTVSQETTNAESRYSATVELFVANRDNYPLTVEFHHIEINIRQHCGRIPPRWCFLSPPSTGAVPQDAIQPRESKLYQIPLDGTHVGSAYPNLKQDYQWGIQGIFVSLPSIGRKELHKGMYRKQVRQQTVRML